MPTFPAEKTNTTTVLSRVELKNLNMQEDRFSIAVFYPKRNNNTARQFHYLLFCLFLSVTPRLLSGSFQKLLTVIDEVGTSIPMSALGSSVEKEDLPTLSAQVSETKETAETKLGVVITGLSTPQ